MVFESGYYCIWKKPIRYVEMSIIVCGRYHYGMTNWVLYFIEIATVVCENELWSVWKCLLQHVVMITNVCWNEC